jgi:quinoprotein glucose dehydrogenase
MFILHLKGYSRVAQTILVKVLLFYFGFVALGLVQRPSLARQENPAPAQSPTTPEPVEPKVRPASGEGQLAIKQFTYSKDLECRLFAAEPDVANIVSFHRDYQGRFYVCETFRQEKDTGVEDNRSHMYWMDDELQALTVQDRINYVLKHVPDAASKYTANDDRIRLVEDRNGDGAADHSQVFAKGFNRLEMGTGADVLSYRNVVYYTCIPDLFKLVDTTGDGTADHRESLHTGFGVRYAFRGHDLHGLVVGPDGRLYFSIGDRGYNVSPDVVNPATGAVFRCELDGSDLEVFCTGLRNPQNLAFDDFGNLFTGDNNSDSGDQARWVFCVPGGDSGWRMYYQYLPDRGPFNREKIWHHYHVHTPAYIIPPIANISDGPSGLDYYPGTGFGDEFKERFFLCDFRGTAFNSGVRSFKNEPSGAFFQLIEAEQPIWGILTTDLQFGSDGKLYVSDWVNGWTGENTGRIYAFSDPQHRDSEIVKEVESLLRNGLAEESNERLIELLGHRDRRVRQEAQFELANRQAFAELKKVANSKASLLARVHAIWGIEQIVRASRRDPKIESEADRFSPTTLRNLIALLCRDPDPEIRAQAAKLCGDIASDNEMEMIELWHDDNLRVRYHAAVAWSKISATDWVPVLEYEKLFEFADQDPIIRHGGIMSVKDHLVRSARSNNTELANRFAGNLAGSSNPNGRLALSVALRKINELSPSQKVGLPIDTWNKYLRQLLTDSQPDVCLEAARAVYDLPIENLMANLADVALVNSDGSPRFDVPHLQDALVSRVIHANLRVGDERSAERLVSFACDSRLNLESRVQAIRVLMQWCDPPKNDPLLYDWRPVDASTRTVTTSQQAIMNRLDDLLGSPSELSAVIFEAVGKLELSGLDSVLVSVVESDSKPVASRIQALRSLSVLNSDQLDELLGKLFFQFDNHAETFPLELAVEMASITSQTRAQIGQSILKRLIEDSAVPTRIKQSAIRSLGSIRVDGPESVLSQLLEKVVSKSMAEELRLDVVKAAEGNRNRSISRTAKDYLASIVNDNDPSAQYVDTLVGGDFESGKRIFETKAEVSCIRCHRVAGSEVAVGPNLAGIGAKRTRQHLLDSIVQPNKEIAEGFGQVKVQTIDGLMQIGLLVEDNETELKLLDADGKSIVVLKDDIEAIQPGLSSMPPDLVKNLDQFELRDLIEYLANQTDESVSRASDAVSGHGDK